MNKYQEYLIGLLKSAITNTAVSAKPEGLNWSAFSAYAEEQQLEHIIYPLLKDCNISDIDAKLWHHLHQRYGRSIHRDCMQNIELAGINEVFSENNLQHIPLKGSVIKKYYPSPELRRSSDIDILIHEYDRENADAALKSIGYKCERSGDSVEDIYKKDNTIIELHVRLSPEKEVDSSFCDSVWSNSKEINDKVYEMDKEYLYVYLLMHLRKHLIEAGGGGIKLILDIWVLNNKLTFDKDKINCFLEQAHITNLCQYAEALSRKWFDDEECTDENILMLENLILNSGAYGNYLKYLDISLSRNTGKGFGLNKMTNFIRLMCPPLKVMKSKYPIVKKYPVLLPLSWIKRVFDSRDEHVKAVIESVNGLSKHEAHHLANFCENIEK